MLGITLPHWYSTRLAKRRLIELTFNAYGRDNVIAVYGTSSTKDSDGSLREFLPCSKLYLAQAAHFRAMPIDRLTSAATHCLPNSVVEVVNGGSIQPTIQHILQHEQADTLLICGSFYIMEEAFKSLGLKNLNSS